MTATIRLVFLIISNTLPCVYLATVSITHQEIIIECRRGI